MRRMGITCLPPCINASEAEFSVQPHEDAHAVRYALGGLKGVGEKAMEILVVERDGQGSFQSLDDFANRVEPRLLNRRQLESLAAGGAFDRINPDRAGVQAAAEIMLAVAASRSEEQTSELQSLMRIS